MGYSPFYRFDTCGWHIKDESQRIVGVVVIALISGTDLLGMQILQEVLQDDLLSEFLSL